MEHVVVPMLMVLVVLSLVTVLLVGLLWWQHNGLAARVAAIESTGCGCRAASPQSTHRVAELL